MCIGCTFFLCCSSLKSCPGVKVTVLGKISSLVTLNACIIFLFLLLLTPSTKIASLETGRGNNFSAHKLYVQIINSVIKFGLLKQYSAVWWVFWSETSWYLIEDVCFDDPSVCSTNDLFPFFFLLL